MRRAVELKARVELPGDPDRSVADRARIRNAAGDARVIRYGAGSFVEAPVGNQPVVKLNSRNGSALQPDQRRDDACRYARLPHANLHDQTPHVFNRNSHDSMNWKLAAHPLTLTA